MKSWKLPPGIAEIAQYIDCYWFLRRQADDTGPHYPKLNPDPAAHLILADARQRYHYEQGHQSFQGHGSHWIYPYSQTFRLDHSAPFAIVGIKFHVGALYALNIPPGQTLNRVAQCDPQSLLRAENTSQTTVLTQAEQSAGDCRQLLDNLLLPWLSRARPDRHSQLVQSALPLLAQHPVAQISEQLHCSQRTLERSFLRVTGLTLKQCQSMNRLEAILEYLHQQDGAPVEWSDIAQRFGFSDQPHLIRHLKDTIGVTPGEYARQRDLTIDVYGDFTQPSH